MTNQELFTTVRTHLLAQNARALLSPTSDQCAYRSPEGLKCAVGCLIPDDRYHERLERQTANTIEVMRAAGLVSDQSELAMTLQSVHDDADVSDWPQRLADVAKKFGLEVVQ